MNRKHFSFRRGWSLYLTGRRLVGDLRMLYALFSRSLPASASQIDQRLLVLVDAGLVGCYPETTRDNGEHEAEKFEQEQVLRLLCALGAVLMTTTPAEVVSFLATMQSSLTCWIADEREILRDDLHDEIVSCVPCDNISDVR